MAFGISYNCVYDGWRIAFDLPNFDVSTFGNFAVELDTDSNPIDGCDGYDYLIKASLVTTGSSHFVTRMWRTPTCSPTAFVATGHPSLGGNFSIFVGQADLGDPGVLRWRARVSNAAENSVDFLPDSGSITTSGFPTISDSYWVVDGAGHVQAYGLFTLHGDLRGHALAAPIVGIARVPDLHGYWLLGRDGGVFSYGSADFYGSTGNLRLNSPVVSMVSTPSGHGYWFVAADGGIFSYGDAKFYGSTGNIHLNRPIVAMRASHSGLGYRFVDAGGAVYNYGDARPYTVGPETGGTISSVVGMG